MAIGTHRTCARIRMVYRAHVQMNRWIQISSSFFKPNKNIELSSGSSYQHFAQLAHARIRWRLVFSFFVKQQAFFKLKLSTILLNPPPHSNTSSDYHDIASIRYWLHESRDWTHIRNILLPSGFCNVSNWRWLGSLSFRYDATVQLSNGAPCCLCKKRGRSLHIKLSNEIITNKLRSRFENQLRR